MIRMVGGHIHACPHLLCGIGLVGISPEGMLGGESQGEEARGAKIQTTRGDIRLPERRLMTAKTDGQPTVFIEGAVGLKTTLDDRSLSRLESQRKFQGVTSSIGRNRKPHQCRTQELQRSSTYLQYFHSYVPEDHHRRDVWIRQASVF